MKIILSYYNCSNLHMLACLPSLLASKRNNVCICMYVCVCMHIRMYVCMYICMYVCIYHMFWYLF